MRVGLAALTMAYFGMHQAGRTAVYRQYLPVCPVLRYQHYWVGCLSGGIPTDFNGNATARAHHLHNRRVNYVNSSGLRPSRRLNRPSASHDICSLGCYNSAVSRFGI